MKSLLFLTRLSAVLLLVMGFVGCGSGNSGPTLYPVVGTVTYQGKPLAGARITFIPEKEGAIAIASSDSSGKFTMKSGADAGVASGPCKVTVALMDSSAGGGGLAIDMKPEDMQKLAMEGKLQSALQAQEKGSLLPAKYGKSDSTPLTLEVKKESNNFAIELTD
ncbi:MAG: carboxypeptidase-like regulatory domain-containing protein [Planctomycetaceae bacterium]|jgi:hypothetical protein